MPEIMPSNDVKNQALGVHACGEGRGQVDAVECREDLSLAARDVRNVARWDLWQGDARAQGGMYTVEFSPVPFWFLHQNFFLSKNFNLRRGKLVSSFHLRLWECTDSHGQSQGYFFPRISTLVLMKYSCQMS